MKKVIFVIVLVCSLLVTVLCAVDKKNNEIPVRPKNVPKEAVWRTFAPIWALGSETEGNKMIWYKDGTLMYKEILMSKHLKMSVRYHKNGVTHRIGQSKFFKNKYFNNDGDSHSWLEIGKWKEYDEEDNLINEWCYSPPPCKYFETVEKCGVEIYYNKDGSIKEKIMHEYKCEYGCEESE